MNAIHKSKVKAIIRKTGTWEGYIAPCNVSKYHIVCGWHIGMMVKFNSIEELENTVNQFMYYNCNAELGNRVRFWTL